MPAAHQLVELYHVSREKGTCYNRDHSFAAFVVPSRSESGGAKGAGRGTGIFEFVVHPFQLTPGDQSTDLQRVTSLS